MSASAHRSAAEQPTAPARPRAFAGALAYGAAAVIVVLSASAVVFTGIGDSANSSEQATGFVALGFILGFGALGVLMVSRLPHHPLGWLSLLTSLAFAAGGAAVTYIGLLVGPTSLSLPMSPALVWFGDTAFGTGGMIAGTFLLLLFPNGRWPSARWKTVGWVTGVAYVLMALSIVLGTASFEGLPIENPVGLPDSHVGLLVIESTGLLLLLGAVLASVASLVIRFLRAASVERQQLKWVALAVVLIAVGLLTVTGWELVNGDAELSDDVENFVISLLFVLIPASVGIAIFRHHLFDIDKLVSRTVSYATVTGLAAGAFALIVVVPTAFIWRGDPPPWLVAAGTLAAAGLFAPLRAKVQRGVDRRFNRSRYDAQVLADGFAGRLQDSREIDALAGDLLATVSSAVQPATLGVWLRS